MFSYSVTKRACWRTIVLHKRIIKRRYFPVGSLRAKIQRHKTKGTQFLAWCVHFYTALGLVAAAGIAVLIVHGGAEAFRWAFVLMLVATLIDSTDGTLARMVRVKQVLPGFDGRRLDDLVDFLTYTFLPLLLLWRAEILPADRAWWLLVPLLASAYGFCQVSVKTDDGFFLGFPSYWNLVAFYLYVLRPPEWLTLTMLLGFALMTFVPTRYLYPTQPGKLNRLTNGLGAVWTGLLLWILYSLPPGNPPGSRLEDGHFWWLFPSGSIGSESAWTESLGQHSSYWLTLLSLVFPVYYLAASWGISLKIWHEKRQRGKQAATLG
jgi:phosphatidylcholine synthase